MTRPDPTDLGEVAIYRTEDGKTALDVRLAGETVWLAQAQIAALFGVNVPAISMHIRNIYAARELTRKATVSKMEMVRKEGNRQVTRNEQLAGILGSVEQTFDGQPLYGSIEEKAAHLPYFVIKDHPFADGNKRIGSFLFILFQRENAYLEDPNGQVKNNDNALMTLALLIAESKPRNKGAPAPGQPEPGNAGVSLTVIQRGGRRRLRHP